LSVFLAFCWFITQEYTRSLRRTQQLLFELGLPVPHWTTIQKAARRFTARVWNLLHRLSLLDVEPYLAAVDSTYYSLTNPSAHYMRRIERTHVSCPAKLSVLVDTRTGTCLACRFRARPAHDARDVPYLLRHAVALPKKLVGDSAYDAEQNVFEPCHDRNIIAVVQPRKGWKQGFYRHKMRKHFDLRTYHRRPTVEGFFSRLKQRFGGNLRCRTARTQRAEVYARIILQNLSLLFKDFFYSTRGRATYESIIRRCPEGHECLCPVHAFWLKRVRLRYALTCSFRCRVSSRTPL
jgi:hypothetical protein